MNDLTQKKSTSIIENVYASPKANVKIKVSCPKCSQNMEEGYMISNSRITWYANSQSESKKMFHSITGIGCKHAASYCNVCHLFILDEANYDEPKTLSPKIVWSILTILIIVMGIAIWFVYRAGNSGFN